MPTYGYQCKMCGHTFEEFQSMTEQPLVRCPKCNTDNLVRTLGAGSGIIFKGSGFYLTDYKRNQTSLSGAGKKKPQDDKTGTKETPANSTPRGKTGE